MAALASLSASAQRVPEIRLQLLPVGLAAPMALATPLGTAPLSGLSTLELGRIDAIASVRGLAGAGATLEARPLAAGPVAHAGIRSRYGDEKPSGAQIIVLADWVRARTLALRAKRPAGTAGSPRREVRFDGEESLRLPPAYDGIFWDDGPSDKPHWPRGPHRPASK